MSNVTIPELGVRDLGQRLGKYVYAKRLPVNGGLDLTYRCNLNCVHCYCNLPAGDIEAAAKELTTGEIVRIMDDLAEAGTLYLLLTGGEPLLRRDFQDIYLYAKKKGFLLTLFTNGTTVTPKIADLLAEWPPYLVDITLYGFTRETYEKVARVPGSYDRCISGIWLLKERGVKVSVKTVVLTLNKHEFADIYRFAKELGAENTFRYDYHLHPRLDGRREPLKYRVSPSEVAAIEGVDPLLYQSLLEYCETGAAAQLSDDLYQCGAGLGLFHIDPYGNLKMCVISQPAYDLRSGRFAEGWLEVIPRIRSQKLVAGVPCNGCPLRAICGQCPARAELEHGSKHTLVQCFHELARERARLVGLSVMDDRGFVPLSTMAAHKKVVGAD